jgi:hypothetical protein
MRPRLLLAALLALAAPARAREEGNIPDYEAGLGLGQAIIIGNQADRLTDTPALYLFWMRRFDSGIWGGAELGYTFGSTMKGRLTTQAPQNLDFALDPTDNVYFTSKVKSNTLWFTPQIKLGVSDEESSRSWRPYAVFGGGYYGVSNKAGKATLSGRAAGGLNVTGREITLAKRSDHLFGFNLGGGFVAHLFTNIELAADVRYHYLLSGDNSQQFLFPAARFNLLF